MSDMLMNDQEVKILGLFYATRQTFSCQSIAV